MKSREFIQLVEIKSFFQTIQKNIISHPWNIEAYYSKI